MLATESRVSPRVLAVIDGVTVFPGGLSATAAGETYDEDNSANLARTLGGILYQTAHNGRDKPLELAVRSFRDPAFEKGLLARTPATTRPVDARVAGHDAGTGIVDLDGVLVRSAIPAEQAAVGESVRIDLPCARPGLSPGFLYLYGAHGGQMQGPMLRLYAHVADPLVSPDVWAATVEFLQSLDVGWHAKVLSNQVLYPRNDAVVIYLQRDGWRHARRIAETLQDTGMLGAGQSPFTRQITDGVSCAFEPSDKRGAHKGLSFGQHRANILAQALVTHASLPDPDKRPVAESVYSSFLDADIDPAEPARNMSSPMTDVLGI